MLFAFLHCVPCTYIYKLLQNITNYRKLIQMIATRAQSDEFASYLTQRPPKLCSIWIVESNPVVWFLETLPTQMTCRLSEHKEALKMARTELQDVQPICRGIAHTRADSAGNEYSRDAAECRIAGRSWTGLHFSHVFPYVLLVSVSYDIPRRTFGTCSLQAALQDGAIRAEKEAHGEGSGDV